MLKQIIILVAMLAAVSPSVGQAFCQKIGVDPFEFEAETGNKTHLNIFYDLKTSIGMIDRGFFRWGGKIA